LPPDGGASFRELVDIDGSSDPPDGSDSSDVDDVSLRHSTQLRELVIKGVDARTMGDALWLPRALQGLVFVFQPAFCPADMTLDFTFDRTDMVLMDLFEPLLDTLHTLTFVHVHLTNFKWGLFQQLTTLRVHEEK
jgi:hypothetical protein